MMRMAIFSKWISLVADAKKCRQATSPEFRDFGSEASGGLRAPLGTVWLSLGKLGEALGAQDGARMVPDGAKMVQDEAKTEPRWGPDEPRRKKKAEPTEVYTP